MKSTIILILLFSPLQVFGEMKIKMDNKGNPVLEQFSEEGFIDCTFKIVNLIETPRSYQFHLVSSHEGLVLGIDVEVVKGIKSGFDTEMNLIKEHVYHKGVIFRRSGVESDRLVSTLSKLYGSDNKFKNLGGCPRM